jgi:hypothetical protein
MKKTSSRLAGIIVALVLAVGLAGCSAVRLGYANLQDLAFWWLDGYVDFNDEQSPLVRTELERLHSWHRQQELPRFVAMLGRMEQIAPGPITPQQVCGFATEIQQRLQVAADQAEPGILALAATLEPEQLQHLERKYRRNNQKFRKDWIEVPTVLRKEKSLAQMVERVEMIYGRLDEAQRAVLKRAVDQSALDPQRIAAERQRRQQDLLQVLRKLSAPGVLQAEAQKLLRGYIDRVQRSPDPAYRTWQEGMVQENCRTLAAVHEASSPAQREQAVRRLRAYQRDFRELSGNL